MNFDNVLTEGPSIGSSQKVLIMLHGRGGTAKDILTLSQVLHVDDFSLLAPQAENNAWYPLSFKAPPQENEPYLSNALQGLKNLVQSIQQENIKSENIYFFGFSQGACLMLEFLARNAIRYGGAVAIAGGLIGDKINLKNYSGNFEGMPLFIGTSDPDFHVPVERVYATSNIFKDMGADVLEKIYPNMGHAIFQDEIDLANSFIFK